MLADSLSIPPPVRFLGSPITRSPCSNMRRLHPVYLFSLQFLPWEICSFLASPSTSFVNSRYHTRFALSNVDFLLTERPAQSGGGRGDGVTAPLF